LTFDCFIFCYLNVVWDILKRGIILGLSRARLRREKSLVEKIDSSSAARSLSLSKHAADWKWHFCQSTIILEIQV